MAFDFISTQLEQKKQSSLYRKRSVLGNGTGRILQFASKQYINFSSNDYLDLANHPDIKKAYINGLNLYGNSACSSSLITGYTKAHQALEELIADWLGFDRALLFTSGFSANLGVLHALGKENNVSFYLDKFSHASLIDGAFTSKAKAKRFKHNDIEQLEHLLKRSNCKNNLAIVEGVYSMDGDLAPLHNMYEITQQNNSWLYVDDAHGIGVLGGKGQGSLSMQGIKPNNDIINMATFGKALGTNGAAVCGSADFIDYCINNARDYIYSTAMSSALAVATTTSISLCKRDDWRRKKIQELTLDFTKKLDKSIKITLSETSIIGVVIGSEKNTLYCVQELKKRGFWLVAIRPPTVNKGESRLRVTISAAHKPNDIKELAQAINDIVGACK